MKDLAPTDPMERLYELACLDAQRDALKLSPDRRHLAFLTTAPAAVAFEDWKALVVKAAPAATQQRENEVEAAAANAILVAHMAIKANGGKVRKDLAPKGDVEWKTA